MFSSFPCHVIYKLLIAIEIILGSLACLPVVMLMDPVVQNTIFPLWLSLFRMKLPV